MDSSQGEGVCYASDVFSCGKLLRYLIQGELHNYQEDLGALPPAIHALIRRATANDPNMRYCDAMEMLDAVRERLESDLSGMPVEAGDQLDQNFMLNDVIWRSENLFIFDGMEMFTKEDVYLLVASRAGEEELLRLSSDQSLRRQLGYRTALKTRDGISFMVLDINNIDRIVALIKGEEIPTKVVLESDWLDPLRNLSSPSLVDVGAVLRAFQIVQNYLMVVAYKHNVSFIGRGDVRRLYEKGFISVSLKDAFMMIFEARNFVAHGMMLQKKPPPERNLKNSIGIFIDAFERDYPNPELLNIEKRDGLWGYWHAKENAFYALSKDAFPEARVDYQKIEKEMRQKLQERVPPTLSEIAFDYPISINGRKRFVDALMRKDGNNVCIVEFRLSQSKTNNASLLERIFVFSTFLDVPFAAILTPDSEQVYQRTEEGMILMDEDLVSLLHRL